MGGRTVLITTIGTRGDVEPFLALAKGLAGDGHAVAICTATRYRDGIEDAGIGFLPMTGALLDLMDTDDGRAALGGVGSIGAMRAGMRLARLVRPINRQMMADTLAAAETARPDVIVFHPKAMAAPHVAEWLGIPAILGVLQPMYTPTAAFPAAGFPALPLGGAYNRATYAMVRASFGLYRKPVNDFRRSLGLAPVRDRAAVLRPDTARPAMTLHAISRHVLARPADWPETAQLTGYWFLDPPESDWRPPPDLAAFLAAGEPPVHVGFGSMPSTDPAGRAALVVEALEQAGVRGLISSGWGGLAPQGHSPRILSIGAAPHAWLFPRMAAVVHHGGAGTAAAGFRAGVPCVICPFFGDQPFWARRSVDLGVGAPSIPQRKLTAERLAAAIRQAVSDPSIRQRAADLGRLIRDEDGVRSAIALVNAALGGKPGRATRSSTHD
ncbi:glycosyltransferase [Bauldia litoralis]|uniref:Sterol 3beta-glucosyltransferase n=1 Tax=Bauldia litoralis TaxID=665467 RepID=A0A1G6EF39_9HYPH|nr:glycosyltransferase [Bauldia litoralis]SDB56002.1 sterol 3beta-glucosyltransferase [Bauldia litoralis]